MTIFTKFRPARARLGGAVTAVFLLAACAGHGLDHKVKDPAAQFSAARIKADIAFLADDTLRGRDTGSVGHRIAANYVAAEYARLGLKPAGDNGGYFQEVPFKTAAPNQDTALMTVRVGDAEKKLTLGDDYVMGGNVRMPNGDITAPVVFVGYGVSAPDFGHDDLAGLDLKGKIVLALAGAPKSFNTEIRAYYASTRTKLMEYVRRGAVGYISVNTIEREKHRPFDRYKKYLGRKSYEWVMQNGQQDPTAAIKVSAAISADTARLMFEGSGHSFDDVLATAEEGSPKGFPLKATVHMKRDSIVSKPFNSPNVLGVLEGSDPKLKDQ